MGKTKKPGIGFWFQSLNGNSVESLLSDVKDVNKTLLKYGK